MSARDAASRGARPTDAPEAPGTAAARDPAQPQPGQEESRARAPAPSRAARPADGGPDDGELVARAQKGDRAALRRLIERHQRRVYQLALGIVKDHDEALDVVQETFVKVHHHLPEFKGDAAFSTWLYRIAYNLAIDALRRSGRGEKVDVEENTLTDEAGRYETWSGSGANPQQSALRRELGERIQRAMKGLSENHRAILLLRELDGLSYEELAATLEIPKGTVMSRLFHARHRLQEALREYLDGDLKPAAAEKAR